MKLEDVDIKKLLPEFMKNDKYDALLADGMSNLFQKLSLNLKRVVIVGQTDYLNEAELDQLARDQNIFWYNYLGSLETKRRQIKEAPLIFNRLGTVWAVEKVMNSYLSNTELEEWFDYGGEPNHFRFKTEDLNILHDDIQTFVSILEKIKRKSQWLDGIYLSLKSKCRYYPACGLIERTKYIYNFTN